MLGVESGRVAMIAGEPGIGKTRLASELARAAHQEGAAVFLGRCHEELLISQPFVEAFSRYVAAVSPELLRGQLGAYGGELARLIPELARRLPGSPRADERRLGGPALPPVRGRRFAARKGVASVAGRAGAGGSALGRQADRCS
jgi:predicted ATPase